MSRWRWRDDHGLVIIVFFFFQAEDGIRDLTVTGVQTCALPISPSYPQAWYVLGGALESIERRQAVAFGEQPGEPVEQQAVGRGKSSLVHQQIGRASCRERV